MRLVECHQYASRVLLLLKMAGQRLAKAEQKLPPPLTRQVDTPKSAQTTSHLLFTRQRAHPRSSMASAALLSTCLVSHRRQARLVVKSQLYDHQVKSIELRVWQSSPKLLGLMALATDPEQLRLLLRSQDHTVMHRATRRPPPIRRAYRVSNTPSGQLQAFDCQSLHLQPVRVAAMEHPK